MPETKRQEVTIRRTVIFDRRYCHPACVGNQGGWCGYFRSVLRADYRTRDKHIRCPECRKETGRG